MTFGKPLGLCQGSFVRLVKDCRLIKALDGVDDDDDDDDGGLLLSHVEKTCSPENSNNFTTYSQTSFSNNLTIRVNSRLVNLASFREAPSFQERFNEYVYQPPKTQGTTGQRGKHKRAFVAVNFVGSFCSEIRRLSWKKLQCLGDRQRFGRGR